MFLIILATAVSLWLVQHYRATSKWFQLPHPGFYVPGVGGGLENNRCHSNIFPAWTFPEVSQPGHGKRPNPWSVGPVEEEPKGGAALGQVYDG